ncbi:MAG: YidC/Oxa1 family membrane protein insertase [Patescibacteria group bacterium]
MWEALVVKPIVNVLIAIYALIPGHSFGLAIILFTILARVLLYPIVKRQLHHSKALRELQPEIQEIKKKHKDDRTAQMMAISALYKQREVRPAAGIGFALLQIPIFLALYQGINRIMNEPQEIIDTSYQFVRDLPWMQDLSANIALFDTDFFGILDLGRRPFDDSTLYIPGLILVFLTAYVQFISSKQMLASQGERKSLRQIFKDQADGKEVDQAEVSAATAGAMPYMIPGIILLVSLGFVAALPLYWLTSGVIGYYQQRRVLNMDVDEALAISEEKQNKPKKLNAKEKKAVGSSEQEAANKKPKKMNAKQKREAMRKKAKK